MSPFATPYGYITGTTLFATLTALTRPLLDSTSPPSIADPTPLPTDPTKAAILALARPRTPSSRFRPYGLAISSLSIETAPGLLFLTATPAQHAAYNMSDPDASNPPNGGDADSPSAVASPVDPSQPPSAALPRPGFTPLVTVVGFHHARGPEVETWFGVQDGVDPAVEYNWTLLPFMALSDGAHA